MLGTKINQKTTECGLLLRRSMRTTISVRLFLQFQSHQNMMEFTQGEVLFSSRATLLKMALRIFMRCVGMVHTTRLLLLTLGLLLSGM